VVVEPGLEEGLPAGAVVDEVGEEGEVAEVGEVGEEGEVAEVGEVGEVGEVRDIVEVGELAGEGELVGAPAVDGGPVAAERDAAGPVPQAAVISTRARAAPGYTQLRLHEAALPLRLTSPLWATGDCHRWHPGRERGVGRRRRDWQCPHGRVTLITALVTLAVPTGG
jgi:hypothetical protein